MKLSTLKDLLIEQIRELYNGEHLQLDSLLKMLNLSEETELKYLIKETNQQILRLEGVFKQFDVASFAEHYERND
jgi:ferritin-like metal-binding protein YciE